MTDRPDLHLVTTEDDGPTPTEGSAPAGDDGPTDRDPLLARAERIAELPLDERPAAFDGLNRAVVAELNQLEEG